MNTFTLFQVKCFFLFAVLFPAALPAQTVRQRSSTEGVSISAQGNLLGWSSDYFKYLDENSGYGPGLEGRLSYGLTQLYEVFADYSYTRMSTNRLDAESFRFSHLTGGIRFNFSSTTHAFRPFAELGYAQRTAKVQQVVNGAGYDNIHFKGGAFHVGAGVNYFVSLPVAISLKGGFQTGGKPRIEVNGQGSGEKADVATFRISLGVILNLSEL